MDINKAEEASDLLFNLKKANDLELLLQTRYNGIIQISNLSNKISYIITPKIAEAMEEAVGTVIKQLEKQIEEL